MARPILTMILGEIERHALTKIVKRPTSEQRMVDRAQIILRRSDCLGQAETARQVGVR